MKKPQEKWRPPRKRKADIVGKGKPLLRYMGDGSQSWAYAPRRDLTEGDREYIEKIVGGSWADILELAQLSTGEPMYVPIAEETTQPLAKDPPAKKEAGNGNDTN
jgi:hypothetical protein